MTAIEVPQTLEYMGGQLNAAPILEDFKDSLDDEEDTRSIYEYLNNLEEEYQARALLAKSKRFFKNGTQRFSGAKATDQTECHKCGKKASKPPMIKNKCLIPEAYEWDEEKVSSDDNEMVEVKVLMALTEENNAVSKEGAINDEWVKISMRKVHTLLEIEDNDDRKHVNTKILRENKNLRSELKELKTITKTWLNSSNKVNQCISEQIPSQKKRIIGVDQLIKDSSSLGQKDLVFIKSSADDTKVTIPGVERPWLSEVEGAVTDSSATDYDSADESLVYSSTEEVGWIISLEREINPRNPQHAFKRCEAYGSSTHTTTDHYDIEWFKRGEALQAKKAEALKSTRDESTNANRSKTPTRRKPIWYLDSRCSRHMTSVKSYLHKYEEQPGPKVVFGDDSTCVTEGYGSIKCNGIVFTKVAFVNGLKYNLISISQLCDAKY
ncbi:hypothetical protein Tco_1156835 [Tanacetum coccineum]